MFSKLNAFVATVSFMAMMSLAQAGVRPGYFDHETGLDTEEADAVSSPSSVAGTSSCVTIRKNWGSKNGTWNLHLSTSSVTKNSRVFASACELDSSGICKLGTAGFTIRGVAPQDGKISVQLEIDWDAPLPTSIDYLICS